MVDALTDFERLGGEAALRPIIEDFTARIFSDAMIGFLFDGKPHRRITEMEYRFAAAHLGGPVRYTGRPLRAAHARSPIVGGHFMRRRQILIETLRAHGADAGVVDRWIAHVDALRDEILGAGADPAACDHAGEAHPRKNLLGGL